jgi:hypothetical protein
MTLLALHYSHNGAACYILVGAIVALNTTYEGNRKHGKASGAKISLSTGQDYLVRETAEEIIEKLDEVTQVNYGVVILKFD